MITEHLMRPGTGMLRFRSDIPVAVTQRILALVNGVGCHVVFTPVPVDPAAIGDAATLAAATSTWRTTKRSSRLSLDLKGLGSWLDGPNDTVITRVAGTPTQWLSDLLVNGLVAGTVSGGSNVSRKFGAYAQSRREALDVVAGLGDWEYEICPNFTVNAGTSVFSTTPRVMITDRDEGPDGALIGLLGGLLDQSITVEAQATKVAVLGQGEGNAIALATATQSIPLKDRNGNTPVLVTVLSAPSEPSTNVAALATNFLALRNLRRSVQVSTVTKRARDVLRPGDYVWLYDLKSGLIDAANQVFYRGEHTSPLKVRVTSMSSPIEEGGGVYIRSNAASPVYEDVSNYVAWESPGAFLEVGEWAPAAYGRANRADPEVEARVAGAATDWATVSLGSANWTTVRTVEWRYEGSRVWLSGAVTRITSAFPANSNLFGLGSGGNPPAGSQLYVQPMDRGGTINGDWVIDSGTSNFRSSTTAPTVAIGDTITLDHVSWSV